MPERDAYSNPPDIDRAFLTLQTMLSNSIQIFSFQLTSPANELKSKVKTTKEVIRLEHFMQATASYDGYLNVEWRKKINKLEPESEQKLSDIISWDHYRIGFPRYLRKSFLKWEAERINRLKIAEERKRLLETGNINPTNKKRYEHSLILSDRELRRIEEHIEVYRDALDVSMDFMRSLLLNAR